MPQMMISDYNGSLPYRIQKIYAQSSEKEQFYLRKILEELSETGDSQTYENVWLADYNEIPVDIDTFLEDNEYLGGATRNGTAVYPYWRKTMQTIFDAGNLYDEIVFSGATRIGKTSTAITCAAYMLYKMMCLKSPQLYFGKKDVSVFSLIFVNVTLDLARSVAYREFNDTIKSSPWFMSRGHMSKSETNSFYIPDGGKISIDIGSSGSSALGKQIFCSVIDEANFARSGIKDINKAKENMLDTYHTISTRIKGTFRQDGQVVGKLFAVSSKKSDNDFLEDHIERQRKSGADKHMYISEAPQWEVLPASNYSPGRFFIAIGNRHQKGYVVPDNECTAEGLEDIQKQGFKLMTPPIDYKPEFIADFDIALRDIAGISVPGTLSFITQELVTSCIIYNRRNPFYNDILSIGTKDNLLIEEFFHLEAVPKEIKSKPLYIHVDLSLNTDKTGIGGVFANGRHAIESEDHQTISQLMMGHLFSVSIQAPNGDKIPYGKITNFICWLRKQGFNIQGVSRDQFQSEYMGQLLEAQGFKVDKISLDRTPDGYVALRSAMQEGRFEMLDVELLQDELIHLQRDAFSGKIDHPAGGSKDTADCVAGALWNCTMQNPISTVSSVNAAKAFASVNGLNSRPSKNTLPGFNSNFYNIKNTKRR